MSHNPPAPELLDLADQMGFMVLDEIFDCWNIPKSPNDFGLIFADWHEQDLRSFIRRDRNHPSIIAWSFGNEVSEQTTTSGSVTAHELHDIVHFEDPTRPATASMNVAAANSSFANVMDIKSLNYQGEGVRTNPPTFPIYHQAYPNTLLWSSESAATLSSRGIYIFSVTGNNSETEGNGFGGNDTIREVSDYDLYAASFGMSPDLVFERHDMFPFAAGEFVWSGFDYLGEPTPYDTSRSSYYGIIDLAGFKKDRFFLYQSKWRPDFPMAHILPHWTWPDRIGQVTPVHVFSAADEAELFVNGVSAGRLQKEEFTYRFRWDNVTYQPGNVNVVTYKNGTQWAVDSKRTVGNAARLNVTADRTTIQGDGYDLSYVTVEVVDGNGDIVPQATNAITFSISGPGEIISTNNGDPTDLTFFPSPTRNAFSGLALAVVRADPDSSGKLLVTVTANELASAKVALHVDHE